MLGNDSECTALVAGGRLKRGLVSDMGMRGKEPRFLMGFIALKECRTFEGVNSLGTCVRCLVTLTLNLVCLQRDERGTCTTSWRN